MKLCDIVLKAGEVALITLKNGRKVTVGEINPLGGVCDDCRDEDFVRREDNIETVKIVDLTKL